MNALQGTAGELFYGVNNMAVIDPTTAARVVNHIPAMVAYWDRSECCVFSNDAYRSWFGKSPQEMQGMTLRALLGDLYELNLPYIRRALAGEKQEFERRIPLPNGGYRDSLATYTPDIQDNVVLGFSVLVADVTRLHSQEQQLAQVIKERDAALAEKVYQLAAIVESSEDGIISKDLNSIVTTWNRGAEGIFGYSASEMVGRSIMRLIPPERQGEEKVIIEKIKRGEGIELFETVGQTKDGRLIDISVRASPIRNSAGTVVGVSKVARDITGRKQAELDGRKMAHKLEEMQKLESLSVLAGGVAHDFNNLLTGILGCASLASQDLPVDSPVQDFLATITRSSRRAADLCKQMLAYSGKGRFVLQNISLNRIIEEMRDLLKVSIGQHAALQFDLCAALPLIEADVPQIRQAIINLVINASEAMQAARGGGITVRTGITAVDRACLSTMVLAPELPEGTYVYVKVSDSGSGISLDAREKIFDPFYTTKFAGRGLGLAAVLGIVRGHGGAIKVHSEPGCGAEFTLLFPCVVPDAPGSALPERATVVRSGQIQVLVVDDEVTVRTTAALMLRRMGCTVVEAADGREALMLFQAQPARFGLVLLDLTMPHLNGEQTFLAMRQIQPEAQVVLMSGFSEDDAILRFNGKGLAGFLQKPFDHVALSEVVQSVVPRSL